MKDARLGKPVIDQLRHAVPYEPAFLTAPPKRAPPEVGHMMPKRRKRSAIGWDRVVGKVAGHDLPQPLPLFRDRLMHPAPKLRLNVLQLPHHAVAGVDPVWWTPFHLRRRCWDAEESPAICAGISAPDGRAGAVRPNAGGAVPRVRANGASDLELGAPSRT